MITIRLLRLQANMTRRELSEIAKVSYKSVIKADENRPVSERVKLKLLTALNERLSGTFTMADLQEV